MKRAVLNLIILALLICIPAQPSLAKNRLNIHADVDDEFTVKNKDLPESISFRITEPAIIPEVITIPEQSLITLKVINAQRELRWHKGGVILCKLISYTPEASNESMDVSDKDLYLCVRKYEAINKKEAWILGTEIVLAQGASFFAPGVDIGYFFIKGAIKREKHPNWFKAGVRNAYDNSIFWFPQKGKNIELSDGDIVQIKNIKPKKAEKMDKKINRRNERFERQASNRIARKEEKTIKRELKNEKKSVDCSVVEAALENIVVDRSVLAEIVNKSVEESKK